MILNSSRFAEAMAKANCFKEGIGPQHKKAFKVICKALNAKIDGTSIGLDVLAFPTGAGKTKALEYYASETPASVLIAVRRTDDADEIAKNINALVGQEIACAAHSRNRLCLDTIQQFRVLVITHEAYKKMVLRSFPYFIGLNEFQGEGRRLHVIDESMNIFETEEITLLQAKTAVEALTPKDAHVFRPILQRMERAKDFLCPSDWNDFDTSILPAYIKKGTRLDHALLDRNDLDLHNALSTRNKETIGILANVPNSVCRVTKGKDGNKFSISRVALPFDKVNAVILDATANHNKQYMLLGKGVVNIINPPEGIRTYKNVTLHVSYGHRLGRVYLKDTSSKLTPSILNELPQEIRSAGKLLICTHSNIEDDFRGYEGLPSYDIAHYGAIDGRNDWNQHDAMLLFGLPYIPPHALEAQAVALEAYHGKRFKRDKVMAYLQKSAIITQIIQAMNRIRCRSVLSDGSCEPASIRLFLPNGELGKEIMDAIKETMPNIQVSKIESSLASRKVKRSKHQDALIGFLSKMQSGDKYLRKEVAQKLKIAKTSFDRLIDSAKDTASELYGELCKIGITIHSPENGGRGNQLYFEKR